VTRRRWLERRTARLLDRVALNPVRWALGALVAGVVFGGVTFSLIEKGESIPDGLWWAVVTMSTVGYGDITPKTNYGRAIGIAVMVVGIGFLSLLIGASAQRFLSQDVEQAEAELSEEVAGTTAEIRSELRAMAARLVELEARLGAGRDPPPGDP
jgi:voltage-gated potassium channel